MSEPRLFPPCSALKICTLSPFPFSLAFCPEITRSVSGRVWPLIRHLLLEPGLPLRPSVPGACKSFTSPPPPHVPLMHHLALLLWVPGGTGAHKSYWLEYCPELHLEPRTPDPGPLKAPPLAKELLALDGYRGKESHFSLAWPLLGGPCSSRWPHPHAHTNSTKWILG